jgi:hypothetical protein
VIGAVSSGNYIDTSQAVRRITTMISVISISAGGVGMNRGEAQKLVFNFYKCELKKLQNTKAVG